MAELHTHAATAVRGIASNIRDFCFDGATWEDPGPIETDKTEVPPGTTDYEGRVVAFTVGSLLTGREYRILIEDVTMDGDLERYRDLGRAVFPDPNQ